MFIREWSTPSGQLAPVPLIMAAWQGGNKQEAERLLFLPGLCVHFIHLHHTQVIHLHHTQVIHNRLMHARMSFSLGVLHSVLLCNVASLLLHPKVTV